LSFLNPLFLFGLLAAAIPVVIHLFTRRRPKEIRFPSLEFLSEVNQSEIRRLRIKQWLLLLLRTLAIAAIALAMSRPALRGSVGFAGGAATSVAVLVDRSGSMGASAGGGARGATLLDEARRVVEDLLGSLGPQDEILLVPYDRTPQPVTPRPSSDLSRVRAAIQGIAAGSATTDHESALALAARSLGESRALNRELFWISDFQRTGLGAAGKTERGSPPDRLVPPNGPWNEARVFVIPMNPASRANATTSDALLAPGDVETSGSTAAAALSVTVSSFDAPAGDLAVEVREVGTSEPLGRGFVSIPARGEVEAALGVGRQ